jgi:uncharacterized protein (DUF2141 family)
MFRSAFPRIAGAVAMALFSLTASAAELKVQITGIADRTGTIHVYVFTSADGFPKEENAAVHVTRAVPDGTQLDMVVQVPDAPAYALMAYQDKNGDGKMNRFLGMIPQEPYAMSRNPDVMGKPKFSESSVQPAAGETIVLKLRD